MKRLRRASWLLGAALLALPFPATAQRDERILEYRSDLQVQDDGTLSVVETIRVRSAGAQIRHGIYRDFPTRYTDRFQNKYEVGFEFSAATRDGAPEDFRIEDRGNGKRIYLGSSRRTLPPGEYTYTLSYTTNRQLGFFADHDELFWNATGNGWIFPIDRVSATVRLPDRVARDAVHLSGYTGRQGSMAHDLTAEAGDDGAFHFAAAHPLGPYEGLTILLSWPRGYFAPPTSSQRLRYFLLDNRAVFVAALGFLVILAYYTVVWSRVGRDPAPGTIVALYEPPARLSPAAMRYLVRMGYDNKVFTSAILNMAAEGYLTIKEHDGTYTLIRSKADEKALSADEKAVAAELFDDRSQIVLKNENHAAISSAIKALRDTLRAAEEKTYFFTNTRYTIPAIVLSAAVLVAAALLSGPSKAFLVLFLCVWLTGWSVGVTVLVIGAVHAWMSVGAKAKAGAVGLTLFALPFLAGEVFGLSLFVYAASPILAALLLAITALHVAFHYLLKAPTLAGRALLDQVEGFKMFLGEVHGDAINRVNPPEQTPRVFEKLLPYALALGVEHAWAQKFSGVLGGASKGGYTPSYYSGGSWAGVGPVGFASAMGGGFAGAIASSATAPGSVSGGGGGGSGGGGGGGGGGGW